jgi:hypothetical protein
MDRTENIFIGKEKAARPKREVKFINVMRMLSVSPQVADGGEGL